MDMIELLMVLVNSLYQLLSNIHQNIVQKAQSTTKPRGMILEMSYLFRYRLIAGTFCSGGVSHQGDGPYKCPKSVKDSKSYGWVAAVVVMGLILVLLVVAFFAIRSEW